jgi:CRP/FNR family cyclic AMP-dependent transcriptional regulator
MLLNHDVETLQTMPFFSKIEPTKLKLIAYTGQRLIYKPNDIIFNKGDIGSTVLIILDGVAEAILPTSTHPHLIATVKKGEIIGELAVLCGIPRTLTLIAKTEVIALSLDKDLFIRLMREIPDFAIQMVHDLANRLAHTLKELDHKMGRGHNLETLIENTH